MRGVSKSNAGILAIACVIFAGCQKINLEKTVDLDTQEAKAPFIVDGPARDQDVTVTVTPEKGTPVDVYVVLEKDSAAALADMTSQRPPMNTLASRTKIDGEAKLTAKVPAKNAYAVIVGNANKNTKAGIKVEGHRRCKNGCDEASGAGSCRLADRRRPSDSPILQEKLVTEGLNPLVMCRVARNQSEALLKRSSGNHGVDAANRLPRTLQVAVNSTG